MGGWVGEKVEEIEAVGMRCCGVCMGGWVGGRVGGWVGYLRLVLVGGRGGKASCVWRAP